MKKNQRGLSLLGLMLVLFLLIVVALLAMKLIPPYMEFLSARNAIQAIARDRVGASVPEIRRSFDARATIDDINSVKGSDLEIVREGNDIVISFGYRREVPLFANLGVYIDFAADSKGGR
jgi:hypothetical protein